MPRLFIALEIPKEVALSLSLLRGGLHGARWIDVENYHMTLRFVGDVDAPTADELIHALDRVQRPQFELSLIGMGSFGSKKPHSLWAGVSASPELLALQAEIERLCQRLRLRPDPRKFTPHITVARLRGARVDDVVSYLSARSNFQTAPFTVSRFVVMSARESVGGGPYVTEEAYPLHAAFATPPAMEPAPDAPTPSARTI